MIRKIIIGILLLYLSAWLGVAYTLENEINKLNKYGFEFQNMEISGFPGAMKFKLNEPKLTLKSGEETQVFASKSMVIIPSLSLKKVGFVIDNQIYLTSQMKNLVKSYQIELDPLTKLNLKFAKPLLFIKNNIFDNFRAFKFESDNIYLNSNNENNNEELAFLEATAINLRRTKIENNHSLDAIFEINYAGRNKIFGFDSLRFIYDGNINYGFNPDNKKIILNKIDLETLELEINENTYLGLFGSVALSKKDIPIGKFDLELQNYPELINLICKNNFKITAKEIKELIDEVTEGQETPESTISIIFSDSGISLNNKNLKDLKEDK